MNGESSYVSGTDWRGHSRSQLGQAICLDLLGHFQMTRAGRAVVLSRGSERLLAFLALRDGAINRGQVAGTLWPDAIDRRAAASLRSELWRLRTAIPEAVDVDPRALRLGDSLHVDFHVSKRLALHLINLRPAVPDSAIAPESIHMLSRDLLPDWYEDWALTEGEQWRQLRLRALESLSNQFRERRNYNQALAAAFAVVRAEPLREAAHEAVILVHLAEGNQSDAIRSYETYRARLHSELGIEPTERLRGLLPRVSLIRE